MSHLQYYAYEGVGQADANKYGLKHAVRIGDRIETSGQGGWDPKTGEINTEINAQIDQAFKNVEFNLKDAGGKGWDQVFRITSYHVPLNDEATGAMIRNMKQWMPNHSPVWTAVGVARLGLDDMRVEIEVVAHIPQ